MSRRASILVHPFPVLSRGCEMLEIWNWHRYAKSQRETEWLVVPVALSMCITTVALLLTNGVRESPSFARQTGASGTTPLSDSS